MWYVIYSEDTEYSLEKRLKARPAHLKRLQKLELEKRLLVAGPCPAVDKEDPGKAGFTGSLVIANFDSLHQAQEWADQDPYSESGVYKSVTVKPFKKVLPLSSDDSSHHM